MTTEELLNRIKRLEFIKVLSITPEIWIESVSLKWKHQDPVDRVLVAHAKMENCSIVSKDEHIRKFYSKTIW